MAGEPVIDQPPRSPDLLDTPAAGPTAIRGSLLRVGGYVTGIALSAGSAALLVRHLGVVDFGHYATVMSLITVCAGVTDLGMTTIGIREYAARGSAEHGRLLSNLLGIRIVVTSAGVLVATAFTVAAGYETRLVIGTLIAGVGLTIQMTQSFYLVPLSAELRLGSVTSIELLRQSISLGAIAALVVAGAALLPFFAVPVLAAVVTLAATYPLVRGRLALRPAFDRAEARRLISEALPFSAATAAYVVYFRVAIIMMSLIATATETGYFATSFRIVEVLVAVPSVVVGAVFPVLARAARDDAARFAHAIRRTVESSTIAGAWLSLALALGAPTAIALIAGHGFAPSVPVLRIQAIALAGTFVTVACQFGLLSLGRYRELLLADGLALPVVAAAVAILVPLDGARGAAIATTATELMLAALSAALLARSGAGARYMWRLLPRVAAAAGLGAAAQLLPVPPLVRVAIATAIYLLVLLALRAIPEELWRALPARSRTP